MNSSSALTWVLLVLVVGYCLWGVKMFLFFPAPPPHPEMYMGSSTDSSFWQESAWLYTKLSSYKGYMMLAGLSLALA